MATKKKCTGDEKNLTRRYLIWCFKTTKENVDRTDRYFTQQAVDHFLLDALTKTKEFKSDKSPIEYKRLIKSFEDYADNKISKAERYKFEDEAKKNLHPNYLYQKSRLQAIEKAIVNFLGAKELLQIKNMYEEEMTSRILHVRDHS